MVGLGGVGVTGEADAVLALLLRSLCGHSVVVGVVVLGLMEGFFWFGFFHNQLWRSVVDGCGLGWTSKARETGHVKVPVVRAFPSG